MSASIFEAKQMSSMQARQTLADNLRFLMQLRRFNQSELAKKAGVSQKTISNMLNSSGPSPTIESVDKVASVFNLDAWNLVIPKLSEDIIEDRSILAALLSNLEHTTKEGRQHILRVAEREAEYSKHATE